MKQRVILWLLWTFTMVILLLAFIMGLALYADMDKVRDEFGKQTKRLLLAASSTALLGSILAVFYGVTSFMILLRRSCTQTIDAGFGYGFLIASTIFCFFWFLQQGLTFTSYTEVAEQVWERGSWSSTDTDVLVAAYVFSYIAAGSLAVLVVAFTWCRQCFKQEALEPKMTDMATTGSSAAV